MAIIPGTGDDDPLAGTGEADQIAAGGGDDEIDGGAGADILSGGGGDDTITGDSGADQLAGGGGDDTSEGGDGNDLLVLESGQDLFNGGEGIDTADARRSPVAIAVDTTEAGTISSLGTIASLIDMENVVGSDFDDAFELAPRRALTRTRESFRIKELVFLEC
jgi:hypothetical protein